MEWGWRCEDPQQAGGGGGVAFSSHYYGSGVVPKRGDGAGRWGMWDVRCLT